MSKYPFLALILLATYLMSCSKEEPADFEEQFHISGGTDFNNIDDFSVSLSADIEPGQAGQWNIISGLVDDKVFLEDDNDPSSIFHGLPGISYELEWFVQFQGKISRDTIKVTFAPLKTWIEDISPSYYTTMRHLKAKKYDRGIWRIEGDNFDWIWNQTRGGTSIPEEEGFHIKFSGFENRKYDMIWETWYGSVSASDTLHFESTTYHQYEALDNLRVLNKSNYYELNEAGNVVKLNMAGDWLGTVFDDLERYPGLKALVHLKWLNISGDGLEGTIEAVGYYKQLEYLDMHGNHIVGLPENFGDLKKLDTLIMDHIQGGHEMESLPESFGGLESLRYLELASVGLKELPESFANLTNLEYLNLEGNTIEKLPDDFGNLKKLKVFRGPALKTNLPESFSGLESLNFCFFTNLILPHVYPKTSVTSTIWKPCGLMPIFMACLPVLRTWKRSKTLSLPVPLNCSRTFRMTWGIYILWKS